MSPCSLRALLLVRSLCPCPPSLSSRPPSLSQVGKGKLFQTAGSPDENPGDVCCNCCNFFKDRSNLFLLCSAGLGTAVCSVWLQQTLTNGHPPLFFHTWLISPCVFTRVVVVSSIDGTGYTISGNLIKRISDCFKRQEMWLTPSTAEVFEVFMSIL